MEQKKLTNPDQLEKYSFLWSEFRLIISAIALFIGGVPPVIAFNPFPSLYSPIGSLLSLAWIISGIASAYLLYRWKNNKKMLFGAKNPLDTYAFFVSIISGINLGLAGILNRNIGMSISMNRTVFALVAIIYLAAAVHLYKRWVKRNNKLF